MHSNIRWRRTAAGLLTMALAMTASGLAAAAGVTLGEQNVRTVLNTAASLHYHAEVMGEPVEGVCYFDPGNPASMRCAWRSAGSGGADASRLRQKVKRDAVKRCKQGGGESCVELFRNGTVTYDGLSPDETRRLEAVLASLPVLRP